MDFEFHRFSVHLEGNPRIISILPLTKILLLATYMLWIKLLVNVNKDKKECKTHMYYSISIWTLLIVVVTFV